MSRGSSAGRLTSRRQARTTSKRVLRAGFATAAANSYEALRPRWRELLRGFVDDAGRAREPMELSLARAGRYARPAARWARLLVSGTASARRPRLLRPRPRSGARRASRRRNGEGAEAERALPEQPDRLLHPLPRLHLASARPAPASRPSRGGAAIPVVVNQDGVGYPGWAGDETEAVNRPLRRALQAADHVLYQSDFSKQSADLFLGEPRGSWEVLRNAVDVNHFTPAAHAPAAGPVLLLGGDQTQAYRLELALRTLAALRAAHPDARLLVTGRLVSPVEPLIESWGYASASSWSGVRTARRSCCLPPGAPAPAHEGAWIPARRSCWRRWPPGFPSSIPASGGTVELVGDEGGIGVPHPDGWERDEPPAPEALADAVERVLADRARYAAAARARVVERFSLEPWLDRHSALFSELASR